MPALRAENFDWFESRLKKTVTDWFNTNEQALSSLVNPEFINTSSTSDALIHLQSVSMDDGLETYSTHYQVSLEEARDQRRFQITSITKLNSKPYVRMHIQALNEFNLMIKPKLNNKMSTEECLKIFIIATKAYGDMLSGFISKVSRDERLIQSFEDNVFEVLDTPAKLIRRGNDSKFWFRYENEIELLIKNVLHSNFSPQIAALILFPQFTTSISFKLKYFNTKCFVNLLPPILVHKIINTMLPNKYEVRMSKEEWSNFRDEWLIVKDEEIDAILFNVVLRGPEGNNILNYSDLDDEPEFEGLHNLDDHDESKRRLRQNTIESALKSVLQITPVTIDAQVGPATPILESITFTDSPVEVTRAFDYSTYNPEVPTQQGRWEGVGRRRKWIPTILSHPSDTSSEELHNEMANDKGVYEDPALTPYLIQLMNDRNKGSDTPTHESITEKFSVRFENEILSGSRVPFELVKTSDFVLRLTSCERSLRFVVTLSDDKTNYVFTRIIKYRWDRLS